MDGWIKLHRKIEEWEWYDDANTVRVFLHILLHANHLPGKWRGIEVGAGEWITSSDGIASALGISRQNVRTSIKRLKSTSELTTKSTNRFLHVTVVNWASYQAENTSSNHPNNHPANQQPTSSQPATNQQLTTNKNEKNEKNGNTDPEDGSKTKSHQIVDWWNSIPKQYGIRSIRGMNSDRTRAAAKLKIHSLMEEIGKSIESADFCHNTTWFTFDWILKEKNLLKLLEGNYTKRPEDDPLSLIDSEGQFDEDEFMEAMRKQHEAEQQGKA